MAWGTDKSDRSVRQERRLVNVVGVCGGMPCSGEAAGGVSGRVQCVGTAFRLAGERIVSGGGVFFFWCCGVVCVHRFWLD